MRWSGSRTRVAGAAAAGAVGLVLVLTHSPASASTGSAAAPAVRHWGAAAGTSTAAAVAPNITGAVALSFTAHSIPKRDAFVDVGPAGGSAGDYDVFEERLTNPAGATIGHDSARCMPLFTTFRCDGSFIFPGKGTIEISGSVTENATAFAVTGGTGDYRNARGQATIVGGSENTTKFVMHLIP